MIRASQILFWFGLSLASITALYHTSDRARELDHELRATDTAIESEQQTIHVLKAEWVFLSNPTRVETEAKKHLGMLRATTPDQVIAMADLDDNLPTRAEEAENTAIGAPTVASVKTALAAPTLAPRPAIQNPVVHKLAVAAVSAAKSTHANEHIKIERTASAQPSDAIGALINGLGSHQ